MGKRFESVPYLEVDAPVFSKKGLSKLVTNSLIWIYNQEVKMMNFMAGGDEERESKLVCKHPLELAIALNSTGFGLAYLVALNEMTTMTEQQRQEHVFYDDFNHFFRGD